MVQDAIQSFHWTGTMTTVHPFIFYHKEEGVVKAKSFAVISDRLAHDTLAVFAFKSVLINEIRRRGIALEHIHYVSDGAAAQNRVHKKMPSFIVKSCTVF